VRVGGHGPCWVEGVCPYRLMSAVVESNRPIGIAVMALWLNHLKHTAADGNNTPRKWVSRTNGGRKNTQLMSDHCRGTVWTQ
jgi:hypothetical protein